MRIVLRGALLAFALTSTAMAQSVSITGGVPVLETFDSLAATATSSALPTGWFLYESSGNTEYLADNGATISGTTYSYGATGIAERAFGSIRSGSNSPIIGARLINNSGASQTELLVQFTGEQWRVGAGTSVDRLDFQYSFDATALNNGTWTDVNTLDFSSRVSAPATTALNGNDAANRLLVTSTLTLSAPLAASATFWIRWVDADATSNDDGLAIDNFSVGLAVDNPPQLASSTPEPGDIDVPVATAITLNFSEAVTTAADWYLFQCGSSILSTTVSGSGSTRTITPEFGMSFNELCTITLMPAQITDTDGTPDTLTGTNTFSFTTVADNAPTVQSITPADAANGIAVNANISINFSEAVDAVGSWITLSCSISGAHPGVISGTDANFVFNPDSNLTPGDICTITLAAAAITDRDGTPQMLSGTNVFGFTVAPDVAPTIQSTVPVQGALNIAPASNLTVVFSEPVTVTANAFAIQCGATAHPYVATTSNQITYTLDPNSNFALSATCTLSIVAAEISDIDGSPNALANGAMIDFTVSAGVSGYYERVDDLSCRGLRAKLHGVIDDHVSFPYTGSPTDVWTLIERADEDPLNPNNILDVYRNRSMPKGSARANGGASDSDGLHYNREHTWPKSLGFPSTTGDMGLPNAPHTDGHMLYASEVGYNSTRGNKPYVNCPAQGSCAELVTNLYNGEGGGSGVFHGNSNWSTGSGFETWKEKKGETARAILYYDLRYEGGSNSVTGQSEPDLVVTDNLALVVGTSSSPAYMGDKSDLIGWHDGDLPTARDVARNDAIAFFQKNRNPFADHPEWVAIAFMEPCTGPEVVAVDDDFMIVQDTTLTKAAPGILRDDNNGINKNGQGLTATLIAAATSGTATITNGSTGAFTYVPNPGFCGNDSFTYQVSNGSVADQGVAHIAVTCTSPDVLPTAVADNVNVIEDSGSNLLDVLGNDTNPDGGPRTVQSVTQPVGGVVTIGAGNANVSFTPNLNFCTTTSFNYTVNGGSSTTVTVTMTCVNDAPTTVGSLSNQNYTVGATVNIATATAFTDVDNATLTYTATNLPPSLTIDLNSGVISGTLGAGDIGAFNVAVTAHDLALPSAAQNFTANVAALPNAIFENSFE